MLSFQRCLVTGGCGYLGHRLVEELLRRGIERVCVFDVRPVVRENISGDVSSAYESRVSTIIGDIRSFEDVKKAAKGTQVIFHIASYGMSGRESLRKDLVYQVNVQGTENIIRAAKECKVSRVVYTSTYNTVFVGQPLVNADAPAYPPMSHYVDTYSRTKSQAEQHVLTHNGVDGLLTCALRCAGIYGEKEERHFPRIIHNIRLGLVRFTIGSADALVEWVYVDNLVHAHILAANKLDDENSVVRGSAYPISDQEPINNFVFLRQCLSEAGYPPPLFAIPVSLMYYFGFLVELSHRLVGPVWNFQPLMTRHEVFKVGVTHYFDPQRVRDQLGYTPIVPMAVGVARTAKYFAEKERAPASSSSSGFRRWLTLCVVLLSLTVWTLIKTSSS